MRVPVEGRRRAQRAGPSAFRLSRSRCRWSAFADRRHAGEPATPICRRPRRPSRTSRPQTAGELDAAARAPARTGLV